jgi:hypothetical protein
MLKLAPRPRAEILRYRFDGADQLRRHFHSIDGSVLFFYPANLKLAQGEPVLLEIGFTNSDQHCALRGNLHSREAGAFRGCWIEFSMAGLVEGLHAASLSPKRTFRRFAMDLVVQAERTEGMPVVCRLLDAGMGGARIAGLPGRTQPGDELSLSLFGSGALRLGRIRVVWTRQGESGVQFLKNGAAARAAIAHLVSSAQAQRQATAEQHHPAACACTRGGDVAAPPIPRAVYRRMERR